ASTSFIAASSCGVPCAFLKRSATALLRSSSVACAWAGRTSCPASVNPAPATVALLRNLRRVNIASPSSPAPCFVSAPPGGPAPGRPHALEHPSRRVVDEVEVAQVGDELERLAGLGAAAGVDVGADVDAVQREEDERLVAHRLDDLGLRLERLLAGLEVRPLLEEGLGPQAAEELFSPEMRPVAPLALLRHRPGDAGDGAAQ